MLEKQIQKAILDYLTITGTFHWRNNSGAYKTEKGGYVRYGAVGSPDIFAMINGTLYGIEVKTPKGVLSDSQVFFGKKLQDEGAKYIVARSIDEFIQLIK